MDPALLVNIVLAGASVVSVIAATVAAAYARNSAVAAQRLAAIEEDRRHDELRTAETTAEMPRTAVLHVITEDAEHLRLLNIGQASARHVTASTGSSGGYSPSPTLPSYAAPIDVPPGSSSVLTLDTGAHHAAEFPVTLRWIDDAGEHELTEKVHL